MNQTIKGLLLGILLSTLAISIYNVRILHAEWFNSRAPDSDSSNLRNLRLGVDRIADELAELVRVQKELLEIERNR